VAEGVALASEPAAVGRRDHADAGGRELEHLGQGAVHVVWCLRRAPERQLAVRRPVRHGRVLLHGEVRAPLEEKQVLAHQIRLGEAALHVAEFEGDDLVEIAPVSVVVDARVRGLDCVLRRRDGRERLVLDHDQVERRCGDLLAPGGDGGNRVSDESHLVERQGVLVLAHGQDAEGDREVSPGEHRMHAVEREGTRDVNAPDTGVRLGGAQHLGEQHAGQEQVIGELGDAGDFRGGVDLAERLPNATEGRKDRRGNHGRVLHPLSVLPSFRRFSLTGGHRASPVPALPPHLAGEPRPIRRPRRS